MSGETKVKRPSPAHKRRTKSERKMTDKESSALLESAGQALAMVQGSKLVGGRMTVCRRLAAIRPRDKGKLYRGSGEGYIGSRGCSSHSMSGSWLRHHLGT